MLDRASGTGGYTLLADTLLPVVHDPSTAARDGSELFIWTISSRKARCWPG